MNTIKNTVLNLAYLKVTVYQFKSLEKIALSCSHRHYSLANLTSRLTVGAVQMVVDPAERVSDKTWDLRSC